MEDILLNEMIINNKINNLMLKFKTFNVKQTIEYAALGYIFYITVKKIKNLDNRLSFIEKKTLSYKENEMKGE